MPSLVGMRPMVPEPGLTKFRKELDRFLARFRNEDEVASAVRTERHEVLAGQGEMRQESAEKDERLEIG